MDLSSSGHPPFTSLGLSPPVCCHESSIQISRKASWGTSVPPPSSQTGLQNKYKDDLFGDVNISANCGGSVASDGREPWNTLDNIAALGLSFTTEEAEGRGTVKREQFSLNDPILNQFAPLQSGHPFNKWMKNLQRRATERRKTVSCDMGSSVLERDLFDSQIHHTRSGHKQSSSGSSFGFVTAVKSATTSMASFSIAPRSGRTGISSRHYRTDRSSKASNTGFRLSEDSSYITRGIVIDQAVTNRLIQRRRVLEEIINTEESYVADVKFLMNVYRTLLASIPTLSLNFRASINRNLSEIVELHEELLGGLHRVVPHSEYTQLNCTEPVIPPPTRRHHRWRSLDAVPEHAGRSSWLRKIPGLTAEPKVAAEVARVFGKKIHGFFVYEEYGAKYEIMIKDVASAYRTIPQWEMYQKGIEALALSFSSLNSQSDDSKKALTIGDLLVKPIQRVCKYPLLFAELLRQTPVCDCPDSHIEIENVLHRLREATTEINRATDNPRVKALMEKSWLLQDRLVFVDMPDTRSRSAVRSLGHIQLCGVLHVSWQTRDSVDGQYLICLLYSDFLLLASAGKGNQIYTVQACIGLSELRVEEVDNGRGLQCHTASFSWKLVFECDHQLFEITMSACSPKEELEWRSRLTECSGKANVDLGDRAVFTSISLEIKPLGAVFGKPGTIARRISIHRATTVGPMSGLCQVIIKNTNAYKDIPQSASSASINRSPSLLTTNRIPVLDPSRAERARLEALLSDVWTRDALPFPGMTSRPRSENPVRASASSMMRKLSVASIASNFTKRSGSVASLARTVEEGGYVESEAPKPSPSRCENHSDEPIPSPELDEMPKSRLSVIQDAKENMQQDLGSSLPAAMIGLNGSPRGTMRRLATLKVKKSWGRDGGRIVTPPLRTSSANSFNQSRNATVITFTDPTDEEKENLPQVQSGQTALKQGKWSKGTGRNRAVMAEGIRSFFR